MNDPELIELAAKAAGIDESRLRDKIWPDSGDVAIEAWNPLINDDDAFTLAVDMGLTLNTRYMSPCGRLCCAALFYPGTFTETGAIEIMDTDGSNMRALMRRAIVRAVAGFRKP